MKKGQFVFFLGGDDVEMRRIAEVARETGCEVRDAGLSWGAKASAYGGQFNEVAESGRIPVLVELEINCDLPETAIVIDHHGHYSGKPPALIQTLNLLGIKPSRKDVLIGAMDAGFVFGLQAIGATEDEIARFLGLDSADNMSIRDMLLAMESEEPEIIAEAERAVAEREQIGGMIVVRCTHSKTAPITTRLLGEQDEQNILILSEDGEVNYYGRGETVREMMEKFSGGWSGGAGLMPHTPKAKSFWEQWGGSAPETAFWGGYPDQREVLEFLSSIHQ